MASCGTVQRPTASVKAQSSDEPTNSNIAGRERIDDSRRTELRLVLPFNIPSTPEAATFRIIQNLGYFAIYYAHFQWIVLFITLIPQRKVSLIYLVIMTYVASLYLLLLRSLPNSNFLHKIIDKRLVLGLLALATMVELILTGAAIHLFITLAATTPIVLVHAVLWVREDHHHHVAAVSTDQETGVAAGELLPLVHPSMDVV